MKKTCTVLTVAFCVLAYSNISAQKVGGQVPYRKGEIIVYFRDGVLDHTKFPATNGVPAKLEINQALINQNVTRKFQDEGVTQIRKLVRRSNPLTRASVSRSGEEIAIPDFYNMAYLYVPEATDIPEFCEKLKQLPGIRYAEPNYILHTHDFTPNDVFLAQQVYLFQFLNAAHINVRRAWDFTMGSSAVKVGVIDSGIDYHHPDLGGSFGPSAPKVKGGYDYDNGDGNPDDDHENSHGTSVAGIIGAFTNDNAGIAGIAGGNGALGNPGVELYALKVVDNNGSFLVGDAAEAIYDGCTSVSAGGYGCHILNMSGGYLAGQINSNEIISLRKAVSYAAQNGSIFVASKGNEGGTAFNYPSDFSDYLVISVGASNNSDTREGDSNYGNNMDFVAPGTDDMVYTTAIGAGHHSFSLTSASAPMVTGIAALLKSVNLNLHRDDVEKIIEISADDVRQDIYSYVNGYHEQMGHGRVNAGGALEHLHAPWVLQHHTATGGTSQKLSPGNGEGVTFLNDANTTISEGWYFAEMHQVTKTVDIPASACTGSVSQVWSRTVNATTGWSAANPNNNLGFSHVVSQTATTATLRTYVYYVRYNSIGQTINAWYPVAPQNVVFAYTTLTNTPAGSISGPASICSNGSFSYVGGLAGSSASWSSSNANGLSINSSGQATRQNNFNGQIIVTANVTTGGCQNVVVTKNIWVGAPLMTNGTINGQSTTQALVCPGGQTLTVTPDGTTNYAEWIVPPGILYDVGLNSLGVNLPPYMPSSVDINAYASNSCGTGPQLTFTLIKNNFGCQGFFMMTGYPNPAQEELVVEMTPFDANTQPPVIEEVILYDNHNNIVRTSKVAGKKITLNVRGLKKGQYYLQARAGGELLVKHVLLK